MDEFDVVVIGAGPAVEALAVPAFPTISEVWLHRLEDDGL
jgi:pyruvate/2-oxoglutarate dehydrogenase complex dihydrolipoamide dehydrogenase (E3) component